MNKILLTALSVAVFLASQSIVLGQRTTAFTELSETRPAP